MFFDILVCHCSRAERMCSFVHTRQNRQVTASISATRLQVVARSFDWLENWFNHHWLVNCSQTCFGYWVIKQQINIKIDIREMVSTWQVENIGSVWRQLPTQFCSLIKCFLFSSSDKLTMTLSVRLLVEVLFDNVKTLELSCLKQHSYPIMWTLKRNTEQLRK